MVDLIRLSDGLTPDGLPPGAECRGISRVPLSSDDADPLTQFRDADRSPLKPF